MGRSFDLVAGPGTVDSPLGESPPKSDRVCPTNEEWPGMIPGPFFIGSGETLGVHDHWVICTARSPHKTAILHPQMHPLGAVQACTPSAQIR